LRLWDATTQAAVRQATLPHPVISLSFHPDGKKLAAAAGTMLYIWDFENNLPPQVGAPCTHSHTNTHKKKRGGVQEEAGHEDLNDLACVSLIPFLSGGGVRP